MKRIVLAGILGVFIVSSVALAAPEDDLGTPSTTPITSPALDNGDGSSKKKFPIVVGVSFAVVSNYDRGVVDAPLADSISYNSQLDSSLGNAATIRLKIGSYTSLGEKSVIGYFVGYQGVNFERSSGVLADAELSPYDSDTGDADMDGVGVELDYFYKTLPNFGFGPSAQLYASSGEACQFEVRYGDGSVTPAQCYKIEGVNLDLGLSAKYYTKGGIEPYFSFLYSRANIRNRAFSGTGFAVGVNYAFGN